MEPPLVTGEGRRGQAGGGGRPAVGAAGWRAGGQRVFGFKLIPVEHVMSILGHLCDSRGGASWDVSVCAAFALVAVGRLHRSRREHHWLPGLCPKWEVSIRDPSHRWICRFLA